MVAIKVSPHTTAITARTLQTMRTVGERVDMLISLSTSLSSA
jgi:hypothetical protein